MPRPTRKTKPLIYVFNEGESEQAYTEFLKKTFSDYAVIKYPKSTGLFEEARDKFNKDKKYRDMNDEMLKSVQRLPLSAEEKQYIVKNTQLELFVYRG